MVLKQVIKYFTGLLGVVLFVYVLVFFAAEATAVRRWQRSGTTSSAAQMIDDSSLVFLRVDSVDFVSPPLPILGDTITSIDDSAATMGRWRDYFDSPEPPWKVVPIEFVHNARTLRTEIRTRVPAYGEFLLVTTIQVLRFLISFLFVVVGLWAFFKRPDSPGVRALALFSFAMGSFMITSVRILPAQFVAFRVPFGDIAVGIYDTFSTFFSAFWLNLAFLFPQPNRFIRKHPAWAYLICYLPITLVVLILVIPQLAQVRATIGSWFLLVMALPVFAGFALLTARYVRAKDRLEKRQTRLVLSGSGVGLFLLFLLVLLAVVFQGWFIENPQRALVTINVAFLGLLLSPVSFAYAFGRYRLLDVEARLRRGTRYVIAVGFLVALIGGAGFMLSVFLGRQLGETGSNMAVFIAVLAAFGVFPLARKAQGLLEEKVYPERQRLRQMILDFLQESTALPDKQSYWMQLEERLRSGLMVDGVYPAMCSLEGDCLLLRDSEPIPIRCRSDFVQRLERERRPMMVDEALCCGAVNFTDDETEWLKSNQVAVVLPLITRGHLIGLVGLGMKTEREDYVAEELRILDSLASQVAVASENMRLLEENVEKHRLEEQLQMARRIQNGFLPQELPPTPGLEIAARSRFCLEVAGDYYDVIPLEDGETVLAVADVSGKGAGAAMLMANLQASLRTAVGVGTQLAGIVGRINDLICRNTPVEEYITFFVGVYNPESREFTYVNAGHNPPLLLRESGQVELLGKGGLILGTMPRFQYDQETIRLAPGELLLMYTDGVSEAMNSMEEEFGEECMKKLLWEHRALGPKELLARLETEVVAFAGSEQFEDDFTLVLVRVEDQ